MSAASSAGPPDLRSRENEAPPGRRLSAEEARLWVEQGVDRPGEHLLGQAGARSAGSVTELEVVVVLVDFPDLPADRLAHPPGYYEELLFSRGVLPGRSVAEYLSISSGGRLEMTGEVRGWFTASRERNWYTNSRGGIGWYPQNSQRLVEEAIWLADPSVNYARYDNEGPDGVPDSGDDDEMIDGLIVVHAGSGREGGGTTPDDFISIYWFLQDPFPADGVFGRVFTLNPEDGNIGIFLHELGHLLGLPDLYDTDGGSFGTGQWSMMSGGFFIDGGRAPADFDAWSKTRLGFVDVVTVADNLQGVAIPPTIESGRVHRLWRNGLSGTEYFLLENRRQAGLDRGLPGSGLVIYHVDEQITTNRVPNHYRVAVEQADGLFQLENRFNDASIGDEGDPFGAGDAFGRYTVPSSLDYEGADTYVHVFNIDGPDATGAMTADLSVRQGPLVEVVDLNLVEIEGDGDGLVQAGELAGLIPSIAVTRHPATGVTLNAVSLDPLGILADSGHDLGIIDAGETLVLPRPIRVQIGSGVPSDPYGLRLRLDVDWDDAPGREVPVELGIGSRVGRDDDFEMTDHGWAHARVRPTSIDQWTYGPDFGRDGSAGFRYGLFSGGYLRGSDAVLTSPTILLPPGAALLFDQAVAIINTDSTRALAGGVIEISVNGGDWQTAFPDGGYPTYFKGNHLEWIGRPLYSNRVMDGAYHTARVDLSGFSGSIRVRFRFFAEGESRFGQGWKIDNVRVVEDATPVRVLAMESRVEGEDVHLGWRLGDPLPVTVRVLRGPTAGAAVPVGEGWMPGTADGFLVDRGAARTLPADYWLEGTERDGSRDLWGPWRVQAEAPLARPWRVVGNPSRDVTRFSWAAALPAGARLELFDVSGRLVFETPLAGRPGTYAWDGRDRQGRRVEPGIYFARVAGTGLSPVRIVRLP